MKYFLKPKVNPSKITPKSDFNFRKDSVIEPLVRDLILTSDSPTPKPKLKTPIIKFKGKVGEKDVDIEMNKITEMAYIISPNNDKILLPTEYPGDLWVYQNLEPNNHIPLEYYQKYKDEHLMSVYMKYWNICYDTLI